MLKIKKHMIMIVFVLISVLMLSSNTLKVLATEQQEIYVEEKVIDENELPGGIHHKTVKAKSMLTKNDREWVEDMPSEAGSANHVPLKFGKYYGQQVNVLEIPRDTEAKVIPWGVLEKGGWTKETVTEIAHDYEKRNPGWKIVGGVNGDFFDINGYGNLPFGPTGAQVTDKDVYHTSHGRLLLGINNFNKAEAAFVSKFSTSDLYTPRPMLAIYDKDDNIIKEVMVDKINATPAAGEISVYFAIYNQQHKAVPVHVENAYIVEDAIDTLAFSPNSLYGKGVISSKNKTTDVQNAQFAIATDKKEITDLLDVDVKIRVQYNLTDPTFKYCDSAIGYAITQVENGVFKGYGRSNTYDNQRYPRNIVGTKADGTIVMTVIDGRQPTKGMYGVAAEENKAITEHYGMVNAFELDGGGSATMVILKDGELKVVNSPSDSSGGEARRDSNGLLVAVKVPKIEYEISKKFDSIEFTVDVLEQMDKNKELYIELDGKKKQVVDGKVLFDKLDSFKNYSYKFLIKEGESFEVLSLQGVITTDKITPTIKELIMGINEKDGVERYEIGIKVDDPDKALAFAVIILNGKTYWASEGKFYIPIEEQNLINSNDWQIKMKYNIQDGNGLKEELFKDCSIKFKTPKVVLDAQIESLNSVLEDMFLN